MGEESVGKRLCKGRWHWTPALEEELAGSFLAIVVGLDVQLRGASTQRWPGTDGRGKKKETRRSPDRVKRRGTEPRSSDQLGTRILGGGSA